MMRVLPMQMKRRRIETRLVISGERVIRPTQYLHECDPGPSKFVDQAK
jgi:hypothetical protein